MVGHHAQAQLQANFSATQQSGCSPLVIQFFDNTTGGTPTQWTWDFGNGNTSSLQNPYSAFINPGKYTVKLIATNASGTSQVVKTNYITVYDNPTVNFTANNTSGCNPLTVNFTDNSTSANGNIVAWQWEMGNGQQATVQNPQVIFTTPGTFNVKLRVTDNKGCYNVAEKVSYISTVGVKAGFNSSSTAGSCSQPSATTFQNTSTAASGTLSYQWDFGDGNTSTQENPVHNYPSVGSYTIKLIASNNQGCTDTIIKNINVYVGSVKADFSIPPVLCENTKFTITNTSTPATTVASTWYFSDKDTIKVINPTKTFTTAGSYTVKLVNDFGTCKDSVEKIVTVNPKPTADYASANNVSCTVPATVNFTNQSTGAIGYTWYFGNNNATSTATNGTYTYNTRDSFTVSLVAINNFGCKDSISKTSFVKTLSLKIQSLTLSDRKGCTPLDVNFKANVNTSLPISKYEWSFGDAGTSSAPEPLHIYTTEGKFLVKLIVTSGTCTDTLKIPDTVITGHKPKAAFQTSSTVICTKAPVAFTDQSTNGPITFWLWNFGDNKGQSIDQNPVYSYSDTGSYSVRLIVENNGCADTLTKNSYIKPQLPIAKFGTVTNCTNRLEIAFKDSSKGAQTYAWDFGDGNNDNTANPTHTYTKAGSYLIELSVQNATTGCTSSDTLRLQVFDSIPAITIPSNVVCKKISFTVALKNYSQSYTKSIRWYYGNGSNATVPPNVSFFQQRYNDPGTYQIAAVINYNNGCRDSATAIPVQVFGPAALFKPAGDSSGCTGKTVNFLESSTTDGIHPIVEKIWDFGDGTPITSIFTAPYTHTYTTPGTYKVSLRVKDTYGCTDSLFYNRTIVRIGQAVASFAVSDTSICPSSNITFSNTSVGTNLTSLWSFGDGNTSNNSSPLHNYTNEGIYDVKLVIKDAVIGCTDSIAKTNYIHVFKPIAKLTASDTFAACPPLLVNFASLSQHNTSIEWKIANTTITGNNTPSYFFTYPGDYIVKLYARNNGGCVDSATKTIRLLGPTATFNYTTTIGCTPLQVSFSSVAANPNTKFIWDFGDGGLDNTTGSNVLYTYTQGGHYLPKLILEDPTSNCRVLINGKDSIKVKYAKVSINSPVPTFTICNSGNATFTSDINTNDVITQYNWSFSNGGNSSQASPTQAFGTPGFYDAKVVVTTQQGCKDSATVTKIVKVINAPLFNINGNTGACLDKTITLSATITNPDTSVIRWSWDMGNGQTATVINPPAQSYNAAGSYNVSTTATNSSGCATTKVTPISIYSLPIVNAGIDTTICPAKPYTLTATGASTYVWKTDNTLSCFTCASPIATTSINKQYIVTGTSTQGCQATDTVNISMQKHLIMSVSKNDTLCLGKTVTLTASGTEVYQWSPAQYLSSTNTASVVVNPDKAGTFTYTVTGQDKKGCFTDVATVKVTAYPIPTFAINADQINLSLGSSTSIATTNSADITQWTWTPATWLDTPTLAQPVTSAKQDVVYKCVAANAGKCTAEDEVRVIVTCNGSNVFIPNTFSPNGDGMNDVFYPRGKGLYLVRSLRIFNRWGELVFDRRNIAVNDPSVGWDGTYKGAKAPSDNYIYILEVQCESGNIIPVRGDINLLR